MNVKRIILIVALWGWAAGLAHAQYPWSRSAISNIQGTNTLTVYPGAPGVSNTNLAQVAMTLSNLSGYLFSNTLPSGGVTLTPTNTNGTVKLIVSSSGGGGSGAVTNAGTLFVGTNGSDAGGLRLRMDSPFASATAAKSNALPGDVIHVYPGGYTNTNATTMSTNGVKWYFEPGAFVKHEGNVSLPPFSDSTNLNGVVASWTVTNRVYGSGTFTFSNALVSDAARLDGVIYVSDPNSDFYVEGDRVFADFSGNVSPIWQSNGTLTARFNKINSGGRGLGAAYPTLWWGGGNGHIIAEEITLDSTDNSGVLYLRDDAADNTTAYNWWVNADWIVASNNARVFFSEESGAGGANFRFWVDAKFATGAYFDVVVNGRGWTYWTGQKIGGTKTNTTTGSGVVRTPTTGIGKLWMKLDKLSAGGAYGLLLQSGTNEFNIAEFEDTANSAGFVGTSAGDHKVVFNTAKVKGNVTNAVGFNHTGGTLLLANGTIDTTAVATGTNAFGGIVANSNLTLKNITLNVASGTAVSLYAATAQTIKVDGFLKVNKPLHPNITVSGGVVVDTSSNVFTVPSGGVLSLGGTNVHAYLLWLSNQVVALQGAKVDVTNGVFTNLSGTNLTAYSTTLAGTNTGSGTGIFTNVAIVGISNSVNTSTPAILISSTPGIGTNDIIRYATITGNGTTNRFALLGDGGLHQPTNGSTGTTVSNWIGGQTLFSTNLIIGQQINGGAVVFQSSAGSIHLYRLGGAVGDGTHFQTWVLNGGPTQFRQGIAALNVVATNFVSSPWWALTNTATTNPAAFITFTNATGTYKINAFNSSGAGSLITP